MPAPGAAAVVTAALRLLRRHWRAVYLLSAAVTLVNTVPDVLRQVLVWDDPSRARALGVDVVGFGTGLLAQLWLTGAVAALPTGGALSPRGALRRGPALAWAAVRRAPGAAAAGVVVGGATSALVTLPASVAALGFDRVLGPLDAPGVGAFAVATASDAVATCLTLPVLALVLVVAARGAPARSP